MLKPTGLDRPRQVTFWSLVVFAVGSFWTFVLDYVSLSTVIWQASVIGLIMLGMAWLVGSGRRWAPLVAAIVTAVLVAGSFGVGVMADRLVEPENIWFYLANMLMLVTGVLAVISGIAATVLSSRARARGTSGAPAQAATVES